MINSVISPVCWGVAFTLIVPTHMTWGLVRSGPSKNLQVSHLYISKIDRTTGPSHYKTSRAFWNFTSQDLRTCSKIEPCYCKSHLHLENIAYCNFLIVMYIKIYISGMNESKNSFLISNFTKNAVFFFFFFFFEKMAKNHFSGKQTVVTS